MIKTGNLQERITPCVLCGKPSTVERSGNMYCSGCVPTTQKTAADSPTDSNQRSFKLASEQLATRHKVK